MTKWYTLCRAVVVTMLALSAPAFAQETPILHDVQIKGNQRVESDTILSYMAVKKNSPFQQSDIDASLKALFGTGLFSDVSINRDGNILRVAVEENPIINELKFEGNKRIEDDALEAEVQLKPRTVYTKIRLQEDVMRLRNIYQKSGRYGAKIVPKVITLDQNRINLVFEINEGPKAKVKKILFLGNHAFSNSRLQQALSTKEARWYRFFSSSDNYDEDRLAFDKEQLRKFYTSRGYADFQVKSVVAELNDEGDAFFITFTIEEGNTYRFGDVTFSSALQDLDTTILKTNVATIAGQEFKADLIEKSINKLIDQLSDLGYAFVDIDPEMKRDPEKRVVGINYSIKEGPKVYIDHINIKGNVRTLDEVVRREFRIGEGDPYNAAKIRRSQQRINNLGYFDKVDIKTDKGSAPDKADINVEVSERSTGEVNFGAGFSTADGALVNASIRERNLLGRGQDLRLGVQRATRGLEMDLGFTEPYFMGRDIAAGFDIFNITRDRERESSYNSESQGVNLRAAYDITEHLNHSVRYSIRNDNITDILPDASLYIKNQEGEYSTSMVGQVLLYDKRDNRFSPTEGYYVRLSQDISGLGGDSKFVRHEARGSYFYPLWKDAVILNLDGKTGYMFGYGGKDTRINERFFVGSTYIRGFDNAGIGPRDALTKDALGGNIYYTGTTEVSFPLGLPEELGFRGAVFVDAGTLTDVAESGTNVLDEPSLRLSTGFGVAWGSPLGPIRIDLAHALMKEDFDETQLVRFSFGTRF